jgi:hypothetical protein
MVVSPVMMPVMAGAAPGVMARVETRFRETFEKVTDPKGYEARRKEAEEAAAGVVSQALILPVLKQIRRDSWGGDGPFSPGTAEKTFGPQFDIQIADRIARSPRLGVTKQLTQRLMKRQSGNQARLDVKG